MNPNKIAFIMCINNEYEFSEACWYINRLTVPDGYETDIISIKDAPSMAAGYNAGMESSDAKYKVYIHQDTFIINKNFIPDMLALFSSDESIGLMGVVGSEKVKYNGRAVQYYDAGAILSNGIVPVWSGRQNVDKTPMYVEFVDGLLLATQVDIRWREDIFDGFDYYDVSQCFEMIRHGYRVAVPYQDTYWVFHDTTFTNMINYDRYCKRFVEEYSDVRHFDYEPESKESKENSELMLRTRALMRQLVDEGQREEIKETFRKSENCGYLHLRPFEVCAGIDEAESAQGIRQFWLDGDRYDDLERKLDDIRFAIKRHDYRADDTNLWDEVQKKYSLQAIMVMLHYYSQAE